MKSINTLTAAVALALTSAGLASAATTVIHVTGSTAFRVADVSAEVAVCGGATAKATYYGSSLTGANYSVVEDAGNTIKFENYFNGSIAGAQALVDNVTTLPFPSASDFPPTTITSAGTIGSAAPTGGTAKGSPSNNSTLAPYATDTTSADIAFSDTSYSADLQIINNSSDHAVATPSVLQVGIVPFVFVINGSSDVYGKLSGLSMDAQKFTYTWQSGGSTLLSFYTGVNADEATTVFPLGRDVDSGTRGTTLAETGYTLAGSGAGELTAAVAQFFPYASATATTNNSATVGVVGIDTTLTNPVIEGLNGVPAESIDGYSMGYADGGYYSGGNLAVGISTAFGSDITNTVIVTSLGVSDAKTALTVAATNNRQPAKLMAYNGSTFDPTNTATAVKIQEGQYTFWNYESLLYVTSHVSATSTQATNLKTQLTAGWELLSSGGVAVSAMNVSRSGDGLNVQ